MATNQDEIAFDETIKERLFSQVSDEEVKTPSKITVVGVGMVGMACSISILLKVVLKFSGFPTLQMIHFGLPLNPISCPSVHVLCQTAYNKI